MLGGPQLDEGAFANELVQHGILCLDCAGALPEDMRAGMEPYIWSALPSGEQVLITLGAWVTRLAETDTAEENLAEWAGGPQQCQPRKLGVIHFDQDPPVFAVDEDDIPEGIDLVDSYVLDVATLDEPESCDLVTAFDAIHDQAHPAQVLAAVARALRSDGVFLMVDIKASSNVADNLDLPWAPFLYTVSTLHCMTVSLGLGGDGLGTTRGHQLATSMLRDAGFSQVEVREIEDDPLNSYYMCRK